MYLVTEVTKKLGQYQKDFFGKRPNPQETAVWLHLPRKFLMENFNLVQCNKKISDTILHFLSDWVNIYLRFFKLFWSLSICMEIFIYCVNYFQSPMKQKIHSRYRKTYIFLWNSEIHVSSIKIKIAGRRKIFPSFLSP